MIGKSLPEYIFIRVAVALLRSVAPASGVYLLISIFRGSFPISKYVGLLAIFEFTFYAAVYLPRERSLQQQARHVPPPLSRAEREVLFNKCLDLLLESGYPIGWFSSADIKKDNFTEWLLWAIFSSTPQEASPEWEDEIEGYLQRMSNRLGQAIPNGKTQTTTSLRINYDPVVTLHRPLIWYTIVGFIDNLSALRLFRKGFKHYSPPNLARNFPPRIFTPLSRRSATRHLSYWYYSSSGLKDKSKPTLVFLHGIGIGLHWYIPFIRDFRARNPTQDILLIEILPISMHMSEALPPRPVMLDAISSILKSLDIETSVVASHSFGTVTAAHILNWQNTSASDGKLHGPLSGVKDYLFIDPIPFLLILPDIARNFCYRYPTTANEWQLWYFASRDADISRTLGRHFFWKENVLWLEDLFLPQFPRRRRFGVILAGDDQIVPTSKVHEYLTGQEDKDFQWQNKDKSLEVLYYKGLDHASVFDGSSHRTGMLDTLERFLHSN